MSQIAPTAASIAPPCRSNCNYLKVGSQNLRTSRRTLHRRCNVITQSSAESQDIGDENDDTETLEQQRQMLSRLASVSSSTMSGEELQELVLNKWNRPYEVRLQKRGRSMYVHVMWKYLGQKSFRMTEEEYAMQLQAVAEYISMWGAAETVRAGIEAATWAPGYTIGGGARAFSIPLGVNLDTGRSGEWNSF